MILSEGPESTILKYMDRPSTKKYITTQKRLYQDNLH